MSKPSEPFEAPVVAYLGNVNHLVAKVCVPKRAPIRIQLSRRKGWRKPAGAVVVSRPSRWGNPFIMGRWLPTKEAVCEAYRNELVVKGSIWRGAAAGTLTVEEVRRELAGKDLACWCPLPKPGQKDMCHAAILLEVANR